MRDALFAAALAGLLALPAAAVNVGVRGNAGGSRVPTVSVAFPAALHPGYSHSLEATRLTASLLSPTPLRSFTAERAALETRLPAADVAAELAPAVQAAAARFYADYNARARDDATPEQMTEWLSRPEQVERLAVLHEHRDLLVRDGSDALQRSFDAVSAHDGKVRQLMERTAAALAGENRVPEDLAAAQPIVAEPAGPTHAASRLSPHADTPAAAAADGVPAPKPAGPTDAEFKKAVKQFLLIAGTVVSAGLLWIGAGLLGFVDPQAGIEFLTVYGVELSLSADNLVAFAAILTPVAMKVSPKTAQRILQVGLWGALGLRVAASLFGLELIASYGSLALMGGGAVLVMLAAKMLLPARYSPIHYIEKGLGLLFSPLSALLGFLKRRFFSRAGGKWAVAGVVAGALLSVALTDITFAVDSIPTALGLTQNATVIILANIASVLGLSQLYVILQKTADKFHLVNKGVGVALAVVAAKMLLEAFHLWHLPLLLSAGIVMAPIIIALALSPFIKPQATEAH